MPRCRAVWRVRLVATLGERWENGRVIAPAHFLTCAASGFSRSASPGPKCRDVSRCPLKLRKDHHGQSNDRAGIEAAPPGWHADARTGRTHETSRGDSIGDTRVGRPDLGSSTSLTMQGALAPGIGRTPARAHVADTRPMPEPGHGRAPRRDTQTCRDRSRRPWVVDRALLEAG